MMKAMMTTITRTPRAAPTAIGTITLPVFLPSAVHVRAMIDHREWKKREKSNSTDIKIILT